MLCFNKLTGEHNAKKYFKKFLFCGIISLNEGNNDFLQTLNNIIHKYI